MSSWKRISEKRLQVGRRDVLKGAAALGAIGAFPAVLRGTARAQDKPVLVNSIRSLTNPYHATWNKGGAAFAKSVGAEYVTLVTEGNSEKGIADIKAILAKTGGNVRHQRRPERQPRRASDRRSLQGGRRLRRHPVEQAGRPASRGTTTRTTSRTSRSAACPTARRWPRP